MAEVSVQAGQVWVRNWRTRTFHLAVDVGRRVQGSSGLMPARTACQRKLFVVAVPAGSVGSTERATCHTCSREDRWFQVQRGQSVVAWVERAVMVRPDFPDLQRWVPSPSWIRYLDWEVTCALRARGFQGDSLEELVGQMI